MGEKIPFLVVSTSHKIIMDPKHHTVDDKGWFHVGTVTCDLCDEPAEYFHPAGGRRCNSCVRP